MTVSFRSPLSLALLDERDTRDTAVQNRLRTMGHQLATFASTADLFAALGSGQRFDLLLLASQAEMAHESLHAVCKVLGMPMLVVPQDGHWEGLPSWNEELARRRRAVLQRADWPVQDAARTEEMVRGAYRFIDASRTVFLRSREIQLPPRSFAFASELFRNVGTVLTREWLWNSIWKAPPQREAGRAIDVCAASVRRKLALNAENGFVLNAVYGKGYQLVAVTPRHSHSASGPATH
jgi:DNA-binding winged helix-turn-helix (wHTH) protein